MASDFTACLAISSFSCLLVRFTDILYGVCYVGGEGGGERGGRGGEEKSREEK